MEKRAIAMRKETATPALEQTYVGLEGLNYTWPNVPAAQGRSRQGSRADARPAEEHDRGGLRQGVHPPAPRPHHPRPALRADGEPRPHPLIGDRRRPQQLGGLSADVLLDVPLCP